ncbi:MAG: tRNA pseudouridine(13) synthase TruD [Nitrososphaerales archaeon]|nr:tRNA pseudouridine(13) synthase TruD [Nitrososphaerales archaeon]
MTLPPELDRAVGMEVYASGTKPCKATLRSTDEDFRVEEALGELTVEEAPLPGHLPLYRVEKSSIDTFHLARAMAEVLKSRVSYAGIKDKRAAAVQFVTPTSTRSMRPERIERENFSAVLVGYVPRPLSRQMASGNRFRIVLRNCGPAIQACIDEVYGLAASLHLPNFYGLQRFGARDAITHRVGRALVKRRFADAVGTLLFEPRSMDNETTSEARKLMSDGRYSEGYKMLPPKQNVERMAAHHLTRKPDDAVGAIRAVPIALRRFYTQAYQSYLFNRTLSLALRDGLDLSKAERGDNWGETTRDGLNLGKVHGVKEPMEAGAVPVVQFAGYAYRNYGSRFDRCLEEVMKEEQVAPKDFYIEDMQEVSVEGGFRRPHLAVSGASHELSDGNAVMTFTLPRGGYATVLLREVIKPSDPVRAGFA